LIPLNRVPNKLKNPTYDEETGGPAPIEEKQGQRDYNHRNSDAVAELIRGMRMLRLVIL
jgi:hypothetical protein